jgi:hypothetical protein
MSLTIVDFMEGRVPSKQPNVMPGPGEYRLKWPVNADKCLARMLDLPRKNVDEERHLIGYSPAVYIEQQCLKPRSHGKDLCHSCDRVFKKETEIGKFKRWNGYITEEPIDSCHMLGTAWAKKCKWTKH